MWCKCTSAPCPPSEQASTLSVGIDPLVSDTGFNMLSTCQQPPGMQASPLGSLTLIWWTFGLKATGENPRVCRDVENISYIGSIFFNLYFKHRCPLFSKYRFFNIRSEFQQLETLFSFSFSHEYTLLCATDGITLRYIRYNEAVTTKLSKLQAKTHTTFSICFKIYQFM